MHPGVPNIQNKHTNDSQPERQYINQLSRLELRWAKTFGHAQLNLGYVASIPRGNSHYKKSYSEGKSGEMKKPGSDNEHLSS